MTATVAETTMTRNPQSIAWYGWLHDEHGIFLVAGNAISFRDSATETWREVDQDTMRRYGCCNGRVDLADAQRLADGPGYAWVERKNTHQAKAA